MKTWVLLLTPLFCSFSAFSQIKASSFNGEYFHRHSLYLTSENRTVHGVEDIVKIQSVSDNEAQILIESYAKNFHSCQLIGKAQVQGDALVFKTPINPTLNRGKKADCVIRISKTVTESGTILKVEDRHDICKLQYCGMQAQLTGQFKAKPDVQVQEKR